jgi:hypothetical protein
MLLAISDSMRSFRCKPQQRFDRMPGATSRFCLYQLSQQDQSCNYRCCFKIKIGFSVTSERSGKNSRRDYCNDAVKICRAHAHGDEREHVEAAINNRLPCAREEKASSPKDHRCC